MVHKILILKVKVSGNDNAENISLTNANYTIEGVKNESDENFTTPVLEFFTKDNSGYVGGGTKKRRRRKKGKRRKTANRK